MCSFHGIISKQNVEKKKIIIYIYFILLIPVHLLISQGLVVEHWLALLPSRKKVEGF